MLLVKFNVDFHSLEVLLSHLGTFGTTGGTWRADVHERGVLDLSEMFFLCLSLVSSCLQRFGQLDAITVGVQGVSSLARFNRVVHR